MKNAISCMSSLFLSIPFEFRVPFVLQSRTQSTVEEQQNNRMSQSQQPNDSTYINYEEEDDFVDETFDPAGTTAAATSTIAPVTNHDDSGSYTTSGLPIMCMALYDFQVGLYSNYGSGGYI